MAKVISTILSLRDNMSSGLLRVARNTQGVTREMRNATRDVVRFKDKVSKAVTGAAKTMGKVGLAAGAGFAAYAVKSGAAFEAQMSKVRAISGASTTDMQRLNDAAKKMGRTTKFSASESGQALEYMAMAGWKTDQMISGLPGIMNLAAASGEDLGLVSDIVTDALTAFGLKAEDAGRFADVLATASSNSNTNVAMMGETFKYAAPLAGALGYSIEDTAVAIGLMANAGIKADQAGTSLRGVLTNLAKPSKENRKYLKKLGVSLTDTAGRTKPLATLLGELRSKFAKLTKAENAEYAAGIAGKNAMAGFQAMMNGSDEDFAKLTKAIDESSGSAKRMADIMNNNLYGQLTLLKSNVESIGNRFYESFGNKAKNAVVILSGWLLRLQDEGTIDRWADKAGAAFAVGVDKLRSGFAWLQTNSEQVKGVLVKVGFAFAGIKILKFAGDTVKAANDLILFGKTCWTIIAPLRAKAVALGKSSMAWVVNTVKVGANKVALVGHKIVGGAAWLGHQTIALAASSAAWVTNTVKIGANKAALVGHKIVGGVVWLHGQAVALAASSAAWVGNTIKIGLNKAALIAHNGIALISAGATGAMTAAQWALNTAFMATPIGWITAGLVAIVAGGVALYKNWDTIKAKASEIWGHIKTAFGGIKDSIVGAFDAAKAKVSGFFSWMDEKISSIPLLGKLYGGAKNAIGGIAGWVSGKIGANANGTHYWGGGLTRVHERGGEIINLPSGTQIIPHDISQKAASGGQSISININVQGNLIGNEQAANQFGEIIVGKIKMALANT